MKCLTSTVGNSKLTQLWEHVPFVEAYEEWRSAADISAKIKIYAVSLTSHVCYNTLYGSCVPFKMFNDDSWSNTRLTRIDNVLFAYHSKEGLMWYNPVANQWSIIYGLRVINAQSVALVEYHERLVLMWTEVGDTNGDTKKLLLTIISLKKTETWFSRVAYPFLILRNIPQGYEFQFCVPI